MQNNREIEVSVIMPVYNTGDYLKTSVESVLKQKNCKFELILIDDGSQDSSGSRCDEYARIDSRVKVFHKKNSGLSAARNTALDMASGEYVTFFDHDDEYLDDLLCDNYKLAKEYNADVVRFDRLKKTFLPNGEILEDVSGTNALCKDSKVVVLSDDEIKEHCKDILDSGVCYGIWNGMYRRQMIEDGGLRFDEDIRYGGEDWVFNYQMLLIAKCYVFNSQTYYIYNRRIGYSTSSKFHENRVEAILRTDAIESQMFTEWEINKTDRLLCMQSKLTHVLEIAGIYNHPNCPYSSKEKSRRIRKCIDSVKLDDYLDRELVKQISRKRRLCVFLITHDMLHWLGLLDKLKVKAIKQ